ncbi:MAG: DUF1549 domain-containing protein, partial [Planctomycetaceae bacterium]|nr:DUF1549 domain-containing protein [Planctomycetaceae bacterium]
MLTPEVGFAAGPLEYNRDILPILADHCFACHGADSAARKGDLRLDQRQAAIDAGAFIEGKHEKSELISRILSDDPDLVMPPPASKNPLSAAQKATLKQWVAAGAAYQPHWSFIKPKRPSLPAVKNAAWSKNAIDQFVLAQLEAHGLSPAPVADASTLFRRLHLDITGLPPTPDDVTQFVADFRQGEDAALSKWIDRLMKSTAWGEHR